MSGQLEASANLLPGTASLNRRLGGTQRWSGRFAEEKLSCSWRESNNDFSVIQSVAQLLCRLRYPGFFPRWVCDILFREFYIHTKFLPYSPISISSFMTIFVFVVVVVVDVNGGGGGEPFIKPNKGLYPLLPLFFFLLLLWRNSP